MCIHVWLHAGPPAYRHFFFFGSGTKCAQLHNINKLSLQSQVIQKRSKETSLYQWRGRAETTRNPSIVSIWWLVSDVYAPGSDKVWYSVHKKISITVKALCRQWIMFCHCDLCANIRGWALGTNKQQSSEGNGCIQQVGTCVLRTLTDAANILKIAANVMCTAMPQNIENYHK